MYNILRASITYVRTSGNTFSLKNFELDSKKVLFLQKYLFSKTKRSSKSGFFKIFYLRTYFSSRTNRATNLEPFKNFFFQGPSFPQEGSTQNLDLLRIFYSRTFFFPHRFFVTFFIQGPTQPKKWIFKDFYTRTESFLKIS